MAAAAPTRSIAWRSSSGLVVNDCTTSSCSLIVTIIVETPFDAAVPAASSTAALTRGMASAGMLLRSSTMTTLRLSARRSGTRGPGRHRRWSRGRGQAAVAKLQRARDQLQVLNRPRRAVFLNLDLVSREVGHFPAVGVGRDDIEHDQLGADLEDERTVLRGNGQDCAQDQEQEGQETRRFVFQKEYSS